MKEFAFLTSPRIADSELNELFSSAWDAHADTDFSYLGTHSLGYICAYDEDLLIGFINIAWNGNRHAFLLDTTVRKEYQKRGLGKALVRRALALAKSNHVEWVHVDFEPQHERFYRSCGFTACPAGLINLNDNEHSR